MARLERYTVLDLLKKYKSVIGTRIEEFIYYVVTEEDLKGIRKYSIDEVNKTGVKKYSIDYKERISTIQYRIIEKTLINDKKLNSDEKCKLKILSLLYREFSEKINPKELEEIKHMLLCKKEIGVLKFKVNEDINDYEIITKDPVESVMDIKNKRTKELIFASLQIANIEELGNMIKEKYPSNIFSFIMNKFLVEMYRQNIMTLDEVKDAFEEGNFDEKYDREFSRIATDYFGENLQLLDKTSLLLNSAAKIILGIRTAKGEKIDEIHLDETDDNISQRNKMEFSLNFLREIYEELESNSYNDILYSISTEDGNEIITVDRDKIGEFLSRCTQNNYVTDTEIEVIHNEILEGILPKELEKRKIANINVQDLVNLSKSYDIKTGDEEKSKLLECALELSEYLKWQGLTTDKKLLNLYLDGEINLDFIKNIDMPEITSEEYNQKFKLIYDRMLYSFSEKEKKEEEQKLSKLAELYKHLETEGKTNIDDLIVNLLTAYGEDYGVEVMYDLYNLKMVSIEKATEWIGTGILFKLSEKEQLPPTKVRELYEKGTIDLNTIARIVVNSPNMTQRFMLIGSIFPEDKENRDYLLKECLSINGESRDKGEGKRGEKKGNTPDYTKHTIDPFDRMRLLSLIDPDYYFEMTLDGHGIVHFPNFKEVVVEKMVDKQAKPSYGTATYILDEKYYNENKDRIVRDGKVHRQEMIKELETEHVERIIHFIESWGKGIKEHFGIKEGSKWSKDELEKIDQAIEKIIENQIVIGENK